MKRINKEQVEQLKLGAEAMEQEIMGVKFKDVTESNFHELNGLLCETIKQTVILTDEIRKLQDELESIKIGE